MPSSTSTTSLLGVALAVLAPLGASIGLHAVEAGSVLRVGVPVTLGTAAALVLVRRERARARRLRGIELAARTVGDHADAGPQDALNSLISAGEFAELHALLRHLRTRESDQLKDVAKKSRNLEALIDALDEPVLATDNNNAVLLCNRSAEVFFEAAAGSLKGRPIAELLTQAEILDMHAAARAGEVRRLRVRLTTPLGARVFQVSASPVPAAWGKGIFGAVLVLRDVTELDQAAAIKTDFVANASHELRTPVAAIRGAAETLEQCVGEDPKSAGRFAGMIVQHAARLEEMLRDLLDLSRLESPDAAIDFREVNLPSLQAALLAQFDEPARRKGIQVSFETEPALLGLHTDPKLLMLILRNLVENALKFAYEQTTIRVVGRIDSHGGPHPAASMAPKLPSAPGGAPGGAERGAEGGADGRELASPSLIPLQRLSPVTVRFEVIDRGIGIPLALQDRVFERYFQVDSARSASGTKRGTGLGLSIVKHAAKTLGGRVGLSSIWKEGTTVWVELPAMVRSGAGERSDAISAAG